MYHNSSSFTITQRPQHNLAVLIDADNISPRYLPSLLSEVTKYGTPTFKRSYGDWTSAGMSSWRQVLNEHAVMPVQQFTYTTGKNCTDSAMIIDAMDILHLNSQVDGFCIVSSDSDFTRLATRLREAGKRVYGMGERKTPRAFVVACERFIYLDLLTAPTAPSTNVVKATSKTNSSPERAGPALQKSLSSTPSSVTVTKSSDWRKVVEFIKSTIDDCSNDDGWAHFSDLGAMLISKKPDFDPRVYGYKKLLLLIKSIPTIELSWTEGNHPRARNVGSRASTPSDDTKKSATKSVSSSSTFTRRTASPASSPKSSSVVTAKIVKQGIPAPVAKRAILTGDNASETKVIILPNTATKKTPKVVTPTKDDKKLTSTASDKEGGTKNNSAPVDVVCKKSTITSESTAEEGTTIDTSAPDSVKDNDTQKEVVADKGNSSAQEEDATTVTTPGEVSAESDTPAESAVKYPSEIISPVEDPKGSSTFTCECGNFWTSSEDQFSEQCTSCDKMLSACGTSDCAQYKGDENEDWTKESSEEESEKIDDTPQDKEGTRISFSVAQCILGTESKLE